MSIAIKNSAQLNFFEQIKERIGETASMAETIADVLEVGVRTAYRRIGGQSVLSMDEMLMLCKHFKIPLDTLAECDKSNVTFAYESFGINNLDIDAYLQSIITILQRLKKIPEIHIYFAAEFVPVFHHFEFEEMTAFKFFYWQKSIVNDKKFEGKKFEFKETSKDTLELAKKAAELYSQIPSTEIWNVETINSTLMQLSYYWEAGLFESEQEALLICDQLILMVKHLQQQTEVGTKFIGIDKTKNTGAPFNMYASEVMIGNNSVLGIGEGYKISLLTFNTFNSLTTTNANFCEESEIWMKNMTRKATLLSCVSEKQRFQFFKKIIDVIEKLKGRIEKG